MFGKQFLNKVLGSIRLPSTPGEDIVCTMTEFTAASIARNVQLYGSDVSTIIVSGGGIHNVTLMNFLRHYLPGVELTTTESACGVSADFKEALCFAYLAYRTLGGLPGNLPSVTGASRSCVLGSVAFP
jgi:anhydro-N-acetylmuramic acid kinase